MNKAKTRITEETIEKLIEEWHESNSKLELHEYLGLTSEQYAHWVVKNELPKNHEDTE